MTRTAKKKPVGTVTFVGAGPGDPEQLTLRAVERLHDADVVVLDDPTREDVVRLHCRADVELLNGALGADGEPMTHAMRARLAVTAAKAGKVVVRLLDGDPGVFGGVGEEAAACAAQSTFAVASITSTSRDFVVVSGMPA